MIRSILTEPNPILRRRSHEVKPAKVLSKETMDTIQDLRETLSSSRDGIGIAAPQIGISSRIFIISEEAKFVDIPPDKRPKEKDKWDQYVYINPEVSKFSRKKVDGAEGCLSVPGKFGIVSRSEKVSINAYDETGNKISHGATKFFARVIQHELDHLDGVLFIDRTKRFIEPGRNEDRL